MRKYQYYDTGADGDRDAYTNNWGGQTFTPAMTHLIASVKLKLFRVGTPGTLLVSIRATSAGKPTGGDLCSGTIDANTLTEDTNGDWYEITLGNGYEVAPDITYAIVIKATGGDADNKVSWRADVSFPTYLGGTYVSSSDSGTDWSAFSGVDTMFEVWGTGPPSPTTITWGNLLKSQISVEKIEEAIDRMIQDHENDPDSHLEIGESLYSHKASEIIDHIVNSIIADKIGTEEIWEYHRRSISAWKRLLSMWPYTALKILKSVWTAEAGENFVNSLTFDGVYIYAGLPLTPSKIIKIDLETMTTVAIWTGAAGEDYSKPLTFDGTYIYIGFERWPAKVIKIDPETMTTVATWTAEAGEDDCYELTSDGTYIYAVLVTTPAKVIKIDPATMTTVDSWTGAAGENHSYSISFDGTYIYIGLGTAPAKVIKINPETMTTVATLTAEAGENDITAITFDGTYIYITIDGAPVKVIKINPTDMTRISTWTGAAGEDYGYALSTDGKYIYFSLSGEPAKLIRKIMRNIDETGT